VGGWVGAGKSQAACFICLPFWLPFELLANFRKFRVKVVPLDAVLM